MGDSSIDDAMDNDMVMKATVTTAYNNNNYYYWRPKGHHMVHTIWKNNTK